MKGLIFACFVFTIGSCYKVPSEPSASNLASNVTASSTDTVVESPVTPQELSTLLSNLTTAIKAIESAMAPSTPMNPTEPSTTTTTSKYDNDEGIVKNTNNPLCQNWRQTLDEHGKKLLILGDRDLVIPQTVEEIDGFCQRADDSLKVMRNMIKACFKPFAKQVGTLALNGAKKAHKSLCGAGRARKEISLADGRCIDTPEKKELLHDMMDEVVKICEEIRSDSVNVNIKMTYVCCYYDFYTKVRKIV